MKLVLYSDGAARGNPGAAAIGLVLFDAHGKEIEAAGQVIGIATNNEAEYQALVHGLERAKAHHATRLEIRMDSQLLAEQLSGRYRVRAPNLKPWHARAMQALKDFESVTIRHIPRQENHYADSLANQALDRAAGSDAD